MSRPTASSAEVWTNCPGSVQLLAAHPDPAADAPRRVEGREWHTVAEHLLRTGELTGTPAQQEGAIQYVEALRALAPLDSWQAEESIRLDWIHPTMPAGRADAVSRHDGWLRVADYKPGFSYVPEVDNWQGLLYLAGLVKPLALTPEWEEARRVSITIVQPRYYGQHPQVRTWEGRASVLRAYVNIVRHAAEQAAMASPPLHVGKWCAKCDAKHACTLLAAAGAGIADWAEALTPVPPDPARIGVELHMLQAAAKLLKARADGLEAQALHFLQSGQAVAGFEMGTTQTRERFDPERVDELLALGDLLGVNLAKPREPITPAQARKLGVDAAVINTYAQRPPGERKLIATDYSLTRRIFNNGK